MKLDKDAHPARSALVAPVVSGLVVAAMTAGFGQLLGSRFLTYQVPLWLLLGVITISVVGAVLNRRQKGQFSRRNDQVFFILCAFNEKHWLAGFTRDLHNSLDRRGFDLVLKIPERDYVRFGQVRHLQNLSERRDRYAGVIISPVEPELLRRDLKEYCVSAGHPVVFVDIDPFGTAEDYPDGTAFVGYATDVIGRCAADYVGEHARKSKISSPSVLVVGSTLHIGRQKEFVKRLRSGFEGVNFIINENGDFDRTRAREIVCENLRSEERVVPNYIFCTNDDMALGAVDALGMMGFGNDGSVTVVGVDGTPEARALIDSQKTPLRATVVQDSCRIAEIAVDLLDKAKRGKHIEKYNYLDPRIFSRDR